MRFVSGLGKASKYKSIRLVSRVVYSQHVVQYKASKEVPIETGEPFGIRSKNSCSFGGFICIGFRHLDVLHRWKRCAPVVFKRVGTELLYKKMGKWSGSIIL